MKLIIRMVSLLCLMLLPYLLPAKLVEGQDYLRLANPQVATSETINVVEFFSYGCPYCFLVEPQIATWRAGQPDSVQFDRIAIPRQDRWLDYAQLFYALVRYSPAQEARLTPIIYQAIHQQKITFDNAQMLIDWVSQHGVDKKQLTDLFYSSSVTSDINQGLKLSQQFELKYVPSVFVDGRYQLILNSQNNYADFVNQLNELIQLARQERGLTK